MRDFNQIERFGDYEQIDRFGEFDHILLLSRKHCFWKEPFQIKKPSTSETCQYQVWPQPPCSEGRHSHSRISLQTILYTPRLSVSYQTFSYLESQAVSVSYICSPVPGQYLKILLRSCLSLGLVHITRIYEFPVSVSSPFVVRVTLCSHGQL